MPSKGIWCDTEEVGFCAIVLWLDTLQYSVLFSEIPLCFPVKVGQICKMPHDNGVERPALVLATESSTMITAFRARQLLEEQTSDEVVAYIEEITYPTHDPTCLECPGGCPLFSEVTIRISWEDDS